MFRNIMVPLDGSALSELAVPIALRIAELESAKLHIVRVHMQSAPTAEVTVTADYDELLRQYEREGLKDIALQAEEAGVRTTYDLLDAPVVNALQAYVEACGVDLVVMTTHGRTGIMRLVTGSIAEQFVRMSNVPVFLVPGQADPTKVIGHGENHNRVLVTLDGSAEAESVLPYATALACIFDAELLLVRMVVPALEIGVTVGVSALNDYLTGMRERAEDYLHEIADKLRDRVIVRTSVLAPETPARGILDCVHRERPDLIAMATHGRRGWDRITAGSVAESVLRQSPVPLLLVRAAQWAPNREEEPRHATQSP